MSWSYNPSSWVSGHVPTVTDFQNIAADIQTNGGNRDSGGYGLANTSYLMLTGGDLPGNTYTVTAASWSGGIATLTLSAASTIAVGQHFSILSVTPSGYNSSDAIATSGTTGTTLKYAIASNPGAWSSGGTVLVDGVAAVSGMIARDAIGFLRVYNGSFWLYETNSVIFQTQKSSVTFVNGNNNNFDPGGYNFIIGTGPTGAFAITGIVPLGTVAGVAGDGQRITVMNNTGQQLTIPYNSASSSAGHKILNATVADIVLTNSGEGNGFEAIYRVDLGVWQVINTFHP